MKFFRFLIFLDSEKIFNRVWFCRNAKINNHLMKYQDIEYRFVKDKKNPGNQIVMYNWDAEKIISRIKELEDYKDCIFVFN